MARLIRVKVRRSGEPKTEATQPEPAATQPITEKPVEATPQEERIKHVGGRRWWLIWIGVVLVLLGIGGFALYTQNLNIMIGFVAVLLILGGGACVYYGLQTQEDRIIVMQGNKKMVTGPVNSVVIRPGTVAFEWIDNPAGSQRRCINDGHWYYVLIELAGQFVEFTLPDQDAGQQYYDPTEFANVVTMTANKKLFEFSPDKFKKISLIVMGVIVGILGIVLIAMGGSQNGG